MKLPKELAPVLAKIAGTNSLGRSEWHEVVCYDVDSNEWQSFAGSDTFEDGEQVIAWTYCSDVEMPNR